MYALYRLVEVRGGKRRRKRLVGVYDNDVDINAKLEAEEEDIGDYSIEMMGDNDNTSAISGKKFKETLIRKRLTELGFPRHVFSGILFNGVELVPIPSGELQGGDYVVPEGMQFGLITSRYDIDNDVVILKTVNARVANTESIAKTIKREQENSEFAIASMEAFAGGTDLPTESDDDEGIDIEDEDGDMVVYG